MIQAVIFDFDGVLVESAHIKTEAFGALFSSHPDRVQEIVAYHVRNAGISRFVKFRHIYENILQAPYTDELGDRLGRQFSDIVLEKVLNAPYVDGAEEFLKQYHRKYLLFVASGTPQSELRDIVAHRGMTGFFRGVFGAPAGKVDIVRGIMADYSLLPRQTLFVGDAEADKAAADAHGVPFILRVTPENASLESAYKVRDLKRLEEMITEIET